MAGREDRTSPFLRPLDFIFVLRPTVAVGMWVFFFGGAALAARATGTTLPLLIPPADVLIGFVAMSAVLGGGCLLNQIADIETDRLNNKLFFLPRGLISLRAAWTELALVWLLAAALALTLPVHFRLVLLASFFFNVTYSAPPLRAKSLFPWDMVWNGLGFGFVSAAAGWATVAPLTYAIVPVGLVYTLAVAGVTASTTVLDVEGDRSEGLRTTAAVLGSRGASVLTLVLVAAAAVLGALIRDPLGFAGPLLSLPLLVRAHVTGERSHRIMANQVMVALFALVASVWSPVLLLLLALVYFGSRAYYRARFDMTYPGTGTP